jgi:hypothetical protein
MGSVCPTREDRDLIDESDQLAKYALFEQRMELSERIVHNMVSYKGIASEFIKSNDLMFKYQTIIARTKKFREFSRDSLRATRELNATLRNSASFKIPQNSHSEGLQALAAKLEQHVTEESNKFKTNYVTTDKLESEMSVAYKIDPEFKRDTEKDKLIPKVTVTPVEQKHKFVPLVAKLKPQKAVMS